MLLKVVGEPQHGRPRAFKHGRQQFKQQLGPVARRGRTGVHPVAHQIVARHAVQIAVATEFRRQRRQQAFAAPLQPIEQASQRTSRDGTPQVRRRRVFKMMPFVNHQALVRRQHGRILPILCLTAHRHIGHEEVVIHHDDISGRGLFARLEEKAAVIELALHAPAQVGLGGHLIPHIRTGGRCHVGQRAVLRRLRPCGDLLHITGAAIIKQRRPCPTCLIQPQAAEIIAPPLEQRETHLLIGEGALQEGEILRHQLLLQRNRVGGYDGAFAIGRRPAQCGHEISQRLPYTGAGFQQRHSTSVEGIGHRGGHGTLAWPVLIIARTVPRSHGLRHESVWPQRHIYVIQRHGEQDFATRDLSHDIHARRLVVDNGKPNAIPMNPRGNLEIRAAGLKESRRMVVQHEFTALGYPWQREHASDVAAEYHTRRGNQIVVINRAHETHFVATGQFDRHPDRTRRFGGQPCHTRRRRAGLHHALTGHVFRGFFLAAGNKTLFRIKR